MINKANEESSHNKGEEGGQTNRAHKILLEISVAINIILAILAGYSTFRTAKLDAAKKSFEHQLLIQKSTPSINIFYVIADIGNLRTLLDSKEPLPFAQDVRTYRIAENSISGRLSADLAELHKGNDKTATITFLIVANAGEVTAFSVAVEPNTGVRLPLGEIEAHTAVMIPISYSSPELAQDIALPEYTKVLYEAQMGETSQPHVKAVRQPANPSWTPTLRDPRGLFVRAAPVKDDSYLKALVPQQAK